MIGLVYFFAALLGLCIGSFLNVLIYRLPRGMNIAKPGSHCPNCGFALKWYHNIPVISWLALRGRCANCKEKISPRYTIVELVNTLFWVLCVFFFWETSIPMACFSALACSVLLTMFFTDLETMIVPDSLQIALLLLGIGATILDPNYVWYSHLIGAFAFALVFFLVSFVFSKKKGKDALGGGDIKLAFVGGLFLGWQKMLGAMLFSTVVGSIVLLIMMKRQKQDRDTEYPFVPFMAAGMILMVFAGNPLLTWYESVVSGFFPTV